MRTTVADIIRIMEGIAPPGMAEDWDNVGLQVGDKAWPVKKIWVSLDPLIEVMEKACSKDIDLIISHHPLLFRPLKSLDFSTPVGTIVQMALNCKTALFAAHTNLDSVRGGINDYLAEKLGLSHLSILNPAHGNSSNLQPSADWGLGRLGELEQTESLDRFAESVKKCLGLSSIKVCGDAKLPIKQVALCTGSGSGLMKSFMASHAQVYVSGDLHYHDARDAQQAGRALIDIGHFASEHIMVDMLSEKLKEKICQNEMDVSVEACRLEKDPFRVC